MLLGINDFLGEALIEKILDILVDETLNLVVLISIVLLESVGGMVEGEFVKGTRVEGKMVDEELVEGNLDDEERVNGILVGGNLVD